MGIRGRFVLTLAVGFAVTGCASGGGTASGEDTGTTITGSGANLLTQGERERETDNTDAAEEALESAYDATDPAQQQQLFQQALQSAEAAIAEDSTNPLAYRLAGLANVGLENYEAAGEQLDRATELRPIYEIELAGPREQAYIDLYMEASPLLEQGEYMEAAEILEQAQAIFPDRPEALLTLAQIYAQERQHDRAIAAIDSAMAFLESERLDEVDPETAAGWREQGADLPLMRAQVLADAGRFEEAVDTYRQVVAEDPTNISVAQDLAIILMQMGNNEEAVAVYDSLMTRPGLSGYDYYRVGVGYYQASLYEKAAEAFEQSVEQSPMSRDALELLTLSLALDSAYAEVPAVAERWIELDPASARGLTIWAQAVNVNGDAQRAGDIIGRAEELPVAVDELMMRPDPAGGAEVTGQLQNRSLQQGQQVTLNFTFYDEAGDVIGTVPTQVTVPGQDVNEVFQVRFDSTEQVAGYGYELQAP